MKITKQKLKKMIKEEFTNVVSESEEHYAPPPAEEPGHKLVVAANEKLHEAAAALDALTDLIDAQGIGALGRQEGGTTIEDVRSKIRRINLLAEYLG